MEQPWCTFTQATRVWFLLRPSLLITRTPTHGGMARLSWLVWLVMSRDSLPVCMVANPSTKSARRRAAVLVETKHFHTDKHNKQWRDFVVWFLGTGLWTSGSSMWCWSYNSQSSQTGGKFLFQLYRPNLSSSSSSSAFICIACIWHSTLYGCIKTTEQWTITQQYTILLYQM